MSTTFPGTIQTFTDPSGTNTLSSPDHAGLHTNMNDTMEAVESVLGTTAGTSVLKDFAAGQFPVRVNSGGTIVQTLTGGTISSSTINNPTIGTPVITIGSDASGDMYYRNSSGTVSRLAIGSSGQFLTTDGTTPSWGTVAQTSSTAIIVSSLSGASGTAIGTAGLGTIVLTKTSNVVINASMQCYANPATDWAVYISTQLIRDGGGIGNNFRNELGAGNARLVIPISYVDVNLSAGTYVYGVKFNSSSGTTVTIEQGNISILAT